MLLTLALASIDLYCHVYNKSRKITILFAQILFSVLSLLFFIIESNNLVKLVAEFYLYDVVYKIIFDFNLFYIVHHIVSLIAFYYTINYNILNNFQINSSAFCLESSGIFFTGSSIIPQLRKYTKGYYFITRVILLNTWLSYLFFVNYTHKTLLIGVPASILYIGSVYSYLKLKN